MLRATLKGLLAHRLRLALTALAVVLGVAFIAGTLVFTDTLNRAFTGLFADAFAGIDVEVRPIIDDELGGLVRPERIEGDVLAAVQSTEGVEEAWGQVAGFAQLLTRPTEANPRGEPIPTGAPLGFSWPATERETAVNIREGRPPSSSNEVVIDANTARQFEFGVGDSIGVIFQETTGEYTIVGISALGEGDGPGGFTSASFDLATAQSVFGAGDAYDTISVVAIPGTDLDVLIGRLGTVIPDTAEAVSAQTAAEEQADAIKEAIGFLSTFILVFGVVALFVGTFIIQNTFQIIVAQRTRELALFRAVGASRRQVVSMVLIEAVMVGLLSGLVGILVGLGIALGIQSLFDAIGFGFPSTGLVIEPRTVVVALVVGMGITVLSALAPALRASRVPPVAAMQSGRVALPRRSLRTRASVGIVITGLGLASLATGLFVDVSENLEPVLLVGVGAGVIFIGIYVLSPVFSRPVVRFLGAPLPRLFQLPGRLAQENAARAPRRTAATAAALMVGLALVTLVSIFAASLNATVDEVIEESFLADLGIQPTAGGFGPPGTGFSTAVADIVAELPEVEGVSRIRSTLARFEGEVDFVGATESNIGDFITLEMAAGTTADLLGEAAALSQGRADDLGASLGDTVELVLGNDTYDLPVVAVFETGLAGEVIVPLELFEASLTEQFDAAVYVRLVDGVSGEEGRAAVEAAIVDYPTATVLDTTGFKEQAQSQINQLLFVIIGLLLLAVVISLIGIVNTLSLSVIERTRELGLLRAVGMSRGQVRSMVRWESVVISVFGAMLGVVVGLAFGWAVISALDEDALRFTIPWIWVIAFIGAAGVAGVVAAVLPASRASNLDILEAIAFE